MNIVYHASMGLALDVVFNTGLTMTVCSVLPDLPLIKNEMRLIKEKRRFNEREISEQTIAFYRLTHSLFFCPLLLAWSKPAFFAYLMHIICDLFTHTGRFAAQPFFPISNWTFPYGRNILK